MYINTRAQNAKDVCWAVTGQQEPPNTQVGEGGGGGRDHPAREKPAPFSKTAQQLPTVNLSNLNETHQLQIHMHINIRAQNTVTCVGRCQVTKNSQAHKLGKAAVVGATISLEKILPPSSKTA